MATIMSWDDLPLIDQLRSEYSDVHKDAFGFRPRDGGVYRPVTEQDYYDAINHCYDSIRAERDGDRQRSLECQQLFEKELTELLELGAADRLTALRWWLGANGLDEEDSQGKDAIHSVLWNRGFPDCLWDIITPELVAAR